MNGVEMMRNPGWWPLRILPVVQDVGGAPSEAGWLEAEGGVTRPIVYYASGGQARYPDLDALAGDGWRPD